MTVKTVGSLVGSANILDDSNPVTQASADAAAPGTATVAARSDHKHGMPTIPTGGLVIVRTADQTITNSAVFTNDDTLSLTLASSKRYLIRGFFVLLPDNAGTTGAMLDLSGGSVTYGINYIIGSVNSGGGTPTIVPIASMPTDGTATIYDSAVISQLVVVSITGTIQTATGGTFIPRFCQHTAVAAKSVKMKAGSFMTADLLN